MIRDPIAHGLAFLVLLAMLYTGAAIAFGGPGPAPYAVCLAFVVGMGYGGWLALGGRRR